MAQCGAAQCSTLTPGRAHDSSVATPLPAAAPADAPRATAAPDSSLRFTCATCCSMSASLADMDCCASSMRVFCTMDSQTLPSVTRSTTRNRKSLIPNRFCMIASRGNAQA